MYTPSFPFFHLSGRLWVLGLQSANCADILCTRSAKQQGVVRVTKNGRIMGGIKLLVDKSLCPIETLYQFQQT